MSKIQYNRADIIGLYQIRPLESLPDHVNALALQKQYGSIIKTTSSQPVNFFKDCLVIKGFNQEILVYSSNTPTPLKTVEPKSRDLFSFDEKIFTPQPSHDDKFSFHNGNSDFKFNQLVNKPLFCYSKLMRFSSLLDKVWYYMDDTNQVQGPYSCIEMDNWYMKGYFDDRTDIAFKLKQSGSFIKLKQLKEKRLTRDERSIYQGLKKRQLSASHTITTREQVQEIGPQTSIIQTQKQMFEFPQEQEPQEKQTRQELIQIDEQNDSSLHVIQKILNLPVGKIGKKKTKA